MRDWGLNEGLECVSCSNLQVLRCHPCACKLFGISFPLNSSPQDSSPMIAARLQGSGTVAISGYTIIHNIKICDCYHDM